jgi:hypothetical protein
VLTGPGSVGGYAARTISGHAVELIVRAGFGLVGCCSGPDDQ